MLIEKERGDAYLLELRCIVTIADMPSMSCICTFIYACTCILVMDMAVVLARIAQLDSGRTHDLNKKGVFCLILYLIV